MQNHLSKELDQQPTSGVQGESLVVYSVWADNAILFMTTKLRSRWNGHLPRIFLSSGRTIVPRVGIALQSQGINFGRGQFLFS